jgi:hypothetical protein
MQKSHNNICAQTNEAIAFRQAIKGLKGNLTYILLIIEVNLSKIEKKGPRFALASSLHNNTPK